MDEQPVLLYLARDLFMGVRIADTATRGGWICVALDRAEEPADAIARARPLVILADTQAPRERWVALVEAARSAPTGSVPAIAFGSHMDLDARDAAKRAGAALVVANSRLVTDLLDLLSRYASPAAGPR